MSKRFLLVLFAIISYNSLFCLNKVYRLKYDNTHVFVIKLSSKNLYSIDLTTRNYNDFLVLKVISKGHYKRSNNLLKMTDDWYNYSMNFKIKDNILVPINSYACLNHRIFEYNGEDIEHISPEKRIDLNVLPKKIKPVKNPDLGTYKCYTDELKCELIIKPKNEYEYKLDDCILLKGFYKRTNNILVLNDKKLGHSFNFIIGNNSIIDNFQIIGTKLMK